MGSATPTSAAALRRSAGPACGNVTRAGVNSAQTEGESETHSGTEHGERAGWRWFFLWLLLGVAFALGAVSLGPLVVVPVAAIGLLLALRPRIRRSAFGLLSGVGLLLLYVAWVQRDGPGTTCWHTATGSGCDQHLNPLPWLVVGAILLATGVIAQARRH